jgi:hypothetical protein
LSPNREKALTNIKTWLVENNRRVTQVEDDEYAFHLEVMRKSDRALPFDILASKKVESILVCWSWALYEEDRKAIRMIDSKVKERFAAEVKSGFNLMNLPIVFYKSPEDLQVMHTQKTIKLDQLTKENLLNVFSELIQALEFTSRKFIDHFSMPVEFDPSSHV